MQHELSTTFFCHHLKIFFTAKTKKLLESHKVFFSEALENVSFDEIG